MKNYRSAFNKPREETPGSTEVLECPPINPAIIVWLESQYPLRRYGKELIAQTGFNLMVACDEGRYEVIDQLKVQYMKQTKEE